MLANRLGVQNIPGIGTTVNVPLDAEADGEFVSTAEAAANDRDAPAVGTVAMTLTKYTKRIEISEPRGRVVVNKQNEVDKQKLIDILDQVILMLEEDDIFS